MRPRIIWSPEDEQSLIDGAERGETMMEAAARFKCSKDTIERKRKQLRKQGRLRNLRSNGWRPEEDAKLIELVKQGMTNMEIAPLLGRPWASVKVRRTFLCPGPNPNKREAQRREPRPPGADTRHVVISAWQRLSGNVLMRTVEGV